MQNFDFVIKPWWVRPGFAALLVFCETFNNAYNLIFVYFEKYGGDPLKRSILNQITVQASYCAIANNLMTMPALAWRIFIGPLHYQMAAIISAITNIITVWWVINTSQIAIIKVLMLLR